MKGRRRYERRMQKLVNHLNKAILRAGQLTDANVVNSDPPPAGTAWAYIEWDLNSMKNRVLVQARLEGAELDSQGVTP